MTESTPSLAALALTEHQVFGPQGSEDEYLRIDSWARAVTYFVGRNGSGKSKAARALADNVGQSRFLSTDRLVGLMSFTNYGWGSVPSDYRGVPLDDSSRPQIESISKQHGAGTDELYSLRREPEVALRVAAFIRRALHRTIELRENAGYLDPFVRHGSTEYSLLRDEGHGLREIVVLLAGVYRTDWKLLVVDEPELHLHPSLARLWLGELEAECRASGRHAVVVTHEPTLLRPASVDDLEAIFVFRPGARPMDLRSAVPVGQEGKISASLLQNPQLVGQVVFSPRPVLLEGAFDVLAVNAAIRRTQPAEVVVQTDLVSCGGNGALAAWFGLCKAAGLDVRAIGDLDCCLDRAVMDAMDHVPGIPDLYATTFYANPATTSAVVNPLRLAMGAAKVGNDPKQRAKWLAENQGVSLGDASRLDKLLEVWREAGLWLHEEGTLEAVLGLSEAQKTRELIEDAAGRPSRLDACIEWAAFKVDPSADVFELLGVAVERIAHAIQEVLRLSPAERFDRPVGPTAEPDGRLVDVKFIEGGRHRITVKLPAEHAGRWLEFDRTTSSTDMNLNAPELADGQAMDPE